MSAGWGRQVGGPTRLYRENRIKRRERTETYTSSRLYFACIFSAPDSILTRLANSEIDLGFSYSLSFFPGQVLMSIEMARGWSAGKRRETLEEVPAQCSQQRGFSHHKKLSVTFLVLVLLALDVPFLFCFLFFLKDPFFLPPLLHTLGRELIFTEHLLCSRYWAWSLMSIIPRSFPSSVWWWWWWGGCSSIIRILQNRKLRFTEVK